MTRNVIYLKTPSKTRLLFGPEPAEQPYQFQGWYGREPGVEDVRLLRKSLRELSEKRLRERDAEEFFIPRFLGSAGVFLVVFFVLSFGIRDPLPYVDEFVAGLVAALAVFWAWSRAGTRSLEYQRRLELVRESVDQSAFGPSDKAFALEALLEKAERMDAAELWAALEETDGHTAEGKDPWLEILEDATKSEEAAWRERHARLQHRGALEKAAALEALLLEGKDLALLYAAFKVKKEGSVPLP